MTVQKPFAKRSQDFRTLHTNNLYFVLFNHVYLYDKRHILVTMRIFKRGALVVALSLVVATLTYFVAIPVGAAILMPNEIRLSVEEITARQAVSPNKFVAGGYDKDALCDDSGRTYVDLKLFGLIKIKRVMVDVLPYEAVYAGGLPIGFVAKTDGVVVLQDGKGYKRGDVITSLDSATITSIGDLERHLGKKRLGLWVKDDISGVGTLTYVNPENNNFAALGHKLVDFETGASVNLRSGDVYNCNVFGIEKSNRKKVGVYESTLAKTKGAQGSILSSNSRGVFGCLNEESPILDMVAQNLYPVKSRYSVKPGKAKILASLDGKNIEEYNIEIIKTRYQKNIDSKGIILRITDKRLLEKTGGIVHGMSGSPIIQNGHIVGAVTHVIQGDVTKGYGIYLDFMLP